MSRKFCRIYRVRLKKMTQHQKCDYSVTHDNFCTKFCTLVGQGRFSRKLLHRYEIDIMPNFKFEFCNCTSLFLRDFTFRRIIFKFIGKNWKLNFIKLTHKCVDVHDR